MEWLYSCKGIDYLLKFLWGITCMRLLHLFNCEQYFSLVKVFPSSTKLLFACVPPQ